MLKKIRSTFIMLRECVSMSVRNICSNRVRSFITVLGILIGVTAVIALITTISGVSGSLSSSFTSMGAGTLSVPTFMNVADTIVYDSIQTQSAMILDD